MKEKLIYMNISLHHVKTSFAVGDKRKESNVTATPLLVVSMMRIGIMSKNFISKSKLANNILGFKADAKIESCVFFTKNSAASNNFRTLAKGNVEGVRYEKSNGFDDLFESSFSLLNLRGNALDQVNTSLKLVSATDILILFCDKDMFKDDRCVGYLDNLKEKTKDENGKPVVKKLIIIFTKVCEQNFEQLRQKFAEICSKFIYKMFQGNYEEILTGVQIEISNREI